MQSRWVPSLRPRGRSIDLNLNNDLLRTVLLVLLLTTLFPILTIGTLNGAHTQAVLSEQVSRQMKIILANEVSRLTDYIDQRNANLDGLVTSQDFSDQLGALLNNPPDSQARAQAKDLLVSKFRPNPGASAIDRFDQVFILSPEGGVLLATDDRWLAENFGGAQAKNEFIRSLIGSNKSQFVYNSLPSYKNKVVLITARSFVGPGSAPLATLVAISGADLTTRMLAEPVTLLPGVSTYYFTNQAGLIGLTGKDQVVSKPVNRKMAAALKAIVSGKKNPTLFNEPSYEGEAQLATAHWMPESNLGLLITISQIKAAGPANLIHPATFFPLLICLIISICLIYYSSTRLVSPVVHLAHTIESFSNGNWSERSSIRRDDEIGLMARSFNKMAEELSDLYQSLEIVVEKRTKQLRIASEVAQVATSTAKLSDMLGRTVELIAERFGFYHVAIYLYDEAGRNLVLREASGFSGYQIKQRGDQVERDAQTLISQVAANNQAKMISQVNKDPLFRPDPLLPDTMGELAVPIAIGSEVLGVLDIQSTLVDAFDQELIRVFETLANQISSTLQITRLLESTQVSYQETALLYRATRQVTQARGEAEIIQTLADAFAQLPFINAILSVEGENFKILVVTDPKTGSADKGLQTLNIPTGQMVNRLAENRIVLIDDLSQPSEYENLLSFLLRRGCKSAALVSILENGHLSKVLVLGSHEMNQINSTTLQPYANLAEVIGASLEKHRVLNTLQMRLGELQTLAIFSQAISAETNLNNLYRVLHEQVIQTLGPDLQFAIAIYNQKEGLIEFPYFYENHEVVTIRPSRLGEGLTSILIQSRQPLLLANEQAITSRSPLISGQPAKSWMGVPLIFAGDVVGAVIMQDLEHENHFDQDDLNLFMTLAPQIATAVRNAQLYSETQQALHAYDQERFLFNTLLNNIPEGISVKDTHGRYIRASESVARLLHISADEIIGKTDFDLIDRDSAEKIFRDEQMVMNLGQPEIGLVEHMVLPSGADAWTHTSRIPIRTASGDPYGMLLIQRDITELKQAEALAQRRAEQVLTAAEIARDATGTLDVKTLLQKSVNLVRERFGFYHASIFLLDSSSEYAILRESTGLAGQKMLETGHRLAVGSKSIVGQVTATGQPLIVNNVTNDPTHLPNPLLPDTRSELAIPLKVGQRILGALDVQSTQFDAFNPEDVGVLSILADQMAVAVVNGELFAKTQELLGKHRLLRQISVAASTSTNLEDAFLNVVSGLRSAMVGEHIAILMLNDEGQLQVQASAGYEGTQLLELRVSLGQGITGQAAQEKRPIRVDDTLSDSRYLNLDPSVRSELAIPILFSDELIGVLNLESTRTFAFDENDQEILGALGNNLGGVIANIRLVSQVRQQVVRERQLFDITSKIRRSVDLETILETSAKEIARSLGARRATIRITAGPLAQPDMPPHESPVQGNGNLNGKSSRNGSNHSDPLDNGHKNGQKE